MREVVTGRDLPGRSAVRTPRFRMLSIACLDGLSRGFHVERVAQHQGGGGDGGEGIGAIASGDVRRRAVNRFVQGMMFAQACRGQQADGARQHGGFVAQDVAKHVVGQDHVEAGGRSINCIAQLST